MARQKTDTPPRTASREEMDKLFESEKWKQIEAKINANLARAGFGDGREYDPGESTGEEEEVSFFNPENMVSGARVSSKEKPVRKAFTVEDVDEVEE